MYKKLLIASAILAASSSIAFAAGNAAPYIGGSIGLTNNSAKHIGDYRGITGNVNAGYGSVVSQNLYLGGEVFVVPGSISVGPSNTAKTSWSVGASIIPGLMLNDKSMVYARLGMVESRFTTPGQTKAGGQAGLGLQTNLCQNWDIRGEYVWTKYRANKSFSSPTTDAFNLGLVYKFD